MPSWAIHLKVANKVCDKLNIYEQKNNFVIGNVIPDIYSGHILKNASKKIEYDTSHYKELVIINGGKFYLPNYDMFKNIHIDDLDDKLILGFLIHLMTDYYFNKYTYKNKILLDNVGEVKGIKTKRDEVLNCGRKTATKMKQEDFESFSQMIELERYNVSYTSNVFESLKKIKTFDVENDDIVKIVNFLNSIINTNEIKTKPLILFSKEELNTMIDECVDFVISYIKSNNIN